MLHGLTLSNIGHRRFPPTIENTSVKCSTKHARSLQHRAWQNTLYSLAACAVYVVADCVG